MEADAVASDLRESGIIPQGCQEQISRAYGRKQRNEILHERLVTNCTREAFIRACDIFIAEEGYPKMNALGEAMKKKLETGKNLVNVCAYMCVLVQMYYRSRASHPLQPIHVCLNTLFIL